MLFDISFLKEITVVQSGIAAAILFVCFIISTVSQHAAIPFLAKLAKKLPGDWLGDVLQAINRPLAIFWLVVGGQLALTEILGFSQMIFPLAFRLIYLTLGTWAACCTANVLPVLTLRHDKNAQSIKKLIRIALKVLILSCFGVILLGELGYNVNGLIMGLGLGGLTLSLAAKDSASNLFAGILLLVERPFEVGDWITCPAAEGTVEDISLRSTKIRTFANTLSVVPNTLICASQLTNVTRMKMRIKQFTIGVTYDTPREKIEEVMARLRQLLAADADVCEDTSQVRLTGFGASSIDIMVLYYTKTTNYKEWLAVTERLNLEILDIMRKVGVSFAFPSRSIYIENTTD